MKKIVSLILVVCMLFSVATISAFAESNSKITDELQEKLDKMSDDDIVVVALNINYNIDPIELREMAMKEPGFDKMELSEQFKVLQRLESELKRQRNQELIIELGLTEAECRDTKFPKHLKLTKARVYELEQNENIITLDLSSNYPDIPDNDFLYLDEFVVHYTWKYGFDGYSAKNYKELYYHTLEDGTIDWAFVECFYTETAGRCYGVFDDMVQITACGAPLRIGYAVYDVQQKKFFDVCDEIDDLSAYDGLREQLFPRINLHPIGDANLDKNLDILDATYIQRVLAKLERVPKDDFSGPDWHNMRGDLEYISDIDRDGERTILDATTIQKKVANIEA